jgi:transposase
VKRFLERHPNVKLHFTPTYSSWLNQVESWFSKLQREVIDRGIFTSVADLRGRSYVTSDSTRKQPNPFSGNIPMSPSAFPLGSAGSGTAH